MTDAHALVGAYAVDALDDDERAAFEQHLAQCAACQSEVAGLREAASLIGATAAVTPPPSLRDQVLHDIATVRPLPPVVSRLDAARRRRFRPSLVLVAAAAVVIALGAGAAIVQPWADESGETQQTLTAAERIAQADDAETFTQQLDGGATATVIRSRELNKAVLITDDMPQAPSGKVYELWLDHEDVGMVAAGLMSGGEAEVVLDGDPATAIGFGITVEPEGGSEEPTLPPVTTISFENA
ncbi:anti-sigma factor [Nocardioides coralli]|uniref:anti-sigma factor n=1 Tax=Nocardioides coralli TaxID=2872154 RepID=UPI001CA43AD1|nr:anti-sigma factor [Nocardioides coralli]QZY29006.1 anti-sigma factor [Nocardioides coralli]